MLSERKNNICYSLVIISLVLFVLSVVIYTASSQESCPEQNIEKEKTVVEVIVEQEQPVQEEKEVLLEEQEESKIGLLNKKAREIRIYSYTNNNNQYLITPAERTVHLSRDNAVWKEGRFQGDIIIHNESGKYLTCKHCKTITYEGEFLFIDPKDYLAPEDAIIMQESYYKGKKALFTRTHIIDAHNGLPLIAGEQEFLDLAIKG